MRMKTAKTAALAILFLTAVPALAQAADVTTHVLGAIRQTLSSSTDAVNAGYYSATWLSTVDPNLAPANIKSGVTIFGILGTYIRYPPSAPQSLTATAGNAQVTLNWAAPSSNGGAAITNYKIYRGTAPGSETYLTTVGNVLTYVDTDLTNGTAYYYKVSAVN
jgi:hypothetical protein